MVFFMYFDSTLRRYICFRSNTYKFTGNVLFAYYIQDSFAGLN